MYISRKWLNDYVEVPESVSAKEFGLKLTLATVEVEGWESGGEQLDKIVVGKITAINPHPQADKLRLVDVSLGNATVTVVCGGTNLREGMLIALAKVGARVHWHGTGDVVTLEPAVIRGQKSDGMICASNEIGLGDQFPAPEGHILDLTEMKLKVGQPLAEALHHDDIVYEIDNKSMTNRPDLWGHYGMAREVAAIFHKKLQPYNTEALKPGKGVSLAVTVEDAKDCIRYSAVAMTGVVVGPSPAWLVARLQAVGLRSINTIVDITNYVMYDLGQPMHAFDANEVKGHRVAVRRAVKGERLMLLDETELHVTPDDVVIADSEKPLALAGVMGGQHSGITDATTTIIFESANFDPTVVRKTAQRHGTRTDSSMRFEKSLDPMLTMQALEKAVALVKQCCPAAVVASKIVDHFPRKPKPVVITTSYDFLRERIGHEMTPGDMKDTLTRLGFKVVGTKQLKITVPSWRATKDVSIQEDIVEEVARMYGYDNMQPVMPATPLSLPAVNKERTLERLMKQWLVNAAGATEAYNYSFISQDDIKGWDFPAGIQLVNPSAEGQGEMRQSLLPGLMGNLQRNCRSFDSLCLFEVGHVFLPQPGTSVVRPDQSVVLPAQPLYAAGVCWQSGEKSQSMTAKGLVAGLLGSLGIPYEEKVMTSSPVWAHPRRVLAFMAYGEVVAMVGEMHPALVKQYDMDDAVGFWHIDVAAIAARYAKPYRYQPVSQFPRTTLDISMIVPSTVTWQQIRTIASKQSALIRSVDLFDVFEHDKIGVGKRSIAFHVVYGSDEHTLTMEEVQAAHALVVTALEKQCQAEVRR